MRSPLRPVLTVGVVALLTAAVAPVSASTTSGHAGGLHRGNSGLLQLAAPATKLHAAESSNWFGYNRGYLPGQKRFTSISAVWTVPTATRHSGSSGLEASSDWVGIGGGCVDTGCGTGVTDETLIQAGTEQDVDSSGKATYQAWWEIIPEPETVTSLAVRPGDRVRVAITQGLPGFWKIQMDNLTTGKGFTRSTPYPSTGLSAEWIEETPLLLGTDPGFSALPNLSVVPFTNATVNGAPANLKASEEMN